MFYLKIESIEMICNSPFYFFFFLIGPSTSFSSCSKYRSKSKTPANEQKKPAEVRIRVKDWSLVVFCHVVFMFLSLEIVSFELVPVSPFVTCQIHRETVFSPLREYYRSSCV